MEPTRAPWAASGKPPPNLGRQGDLPASKAPWARGQTRRLDVTIHAEPRWPPVAVPRPDDGTHQSWPPASKRILSIDMLEEFLRSKPMEDFMSFVLYLNEAAKGRAIDSSDAGSPKDSVAARKLLNLLKELELIIEGTPPSEHRMRYGNPAFRTWMASMVEAAPKLLDPLLEGNLTYALPEVQSYLVDSFGNATRIDYGTGHETTFVAFLYCLARLGVIASDDASSVVLKIFPRYLILMRRLQTTYWLEPAGSHGVWGLDDYQFFPFFWGSAQLIDHPDIVPGSIHSDAIVNEGADKYLYLAAVAFVRKVKKGPLAQTSPMLTDISGLPSWSRVNKGMIKMYQAEVVSKLPIMQHFLIGNLIPLKY